MSGEGFEAVLARLDANVTNLVANVARVEQAQNNLVNRERLEIEVRARETDIARLQTEQASFALDSRADRAKLRDRIEILEGDRDVQRGVTRALSAIGALALVVIGVLLGYILQHGV